MKKRYPLLIVGTALLLLLLITAVVNRYGANNLAAMIKLHVNDEQFVKLKDGNRYDLYLTKMDKGKGYDRLKLYMHNSGWTFQELMGSAYVFVKDGRRTLVSTKMLSRYFIEVSIENTIR